MEKLSKINYFWLYRMVLTSFLGDLKPWKGISTKMRCPK
jgi:hypothetical protein